jgi:eukaryotic-like serine/threonine-protein kinase
MGEVYRAKDLRLDRIVALKVLAPAFASDVALKERFAREARSLAALSHPHICPVFDVGSQDGIDFLVMEYLKGETLEQRLKKGALALDQALQIGIQIGDALTAAHRAGIIHRDLKPGNIILTKAGAKLLDFGLAKAGAPAVAGDLSMLPTTPPNLTVQGTILGTFQYMAPEQLEGQEADARTDIFAFGAVLYEMVTGKKAFAGGSQASLIAAILERDPPRVSEVRPDSPPGLDRLVSKCLAKNRDTRWQTSQDLLDELRWTTEQRSTVSEAAGNHKRGTGVPWMVAAVGVMSTVIMGWLHYREAPQALGRETRLEINIPSSTQPFSFALSPDATQLVFVASGDGPSRLWLRPLSAVTAQPLAGTEGATYPFWSPDSQSVGFFVGSKLLRIDVAGGPPQLLATTVGAGRGGTWSSDGTILFAGGSSAPLVRVPDSGGSMTVVTKLAGHNSHRFPHFLPDGRQFLFYASQGPSDVGIYLGSLDGREPTRVTSSDTFGMYSGGRLFWVRGGVLVAQSLDLRNGQLLGEPENVADTVAYSSASTGAFSMANDGTIAYRTGGAQQRQLQWFTRTGEPLGALGSPGDLSMPSVSPDGKRVAVGRDGDIWVLDGTRTSRFTFDPAADGNPMWSADGTQIAFSSYRADPGHRDVYVKLASGAANEQLLVESSDDKVATSWSTDNRWLLYHARQPDRNLWVLPLFGQRKPWLFLKSRFEERQGQVSPNGRWIAYMSDESGRTEIYVRPFVPPDEIGADSAARGGQWQVSTGSGIFPRWRADGTELYYVGPDGELMASEIKTTGSTLQVGTPITLFETQIHGGGADMNQGRQFDVSEDGRFLINAVVDTAASPITLLHNWKPAR